MSETVEKLSQKEIAQRGWEMQNNVTEDLFRYNHEEHQKMMQARPWQKDVTFFKTVRISALALLKMVMHARSGGNIEVMGLMLGRADTGTMIVMDSFPLPVEATETRVNAAAEANEYLVQYLDAAKRAGRVENVIGWYHSHPGYGCWLSGIDVDTQSQNQQFQEPWLAVVIDPIRTIAAGKVDLGAFRTYPKGYLPPQEKESEHRNIPLKKVEDFGTHYKQYYPLAVSYFKTSSDKRLINQLWNQYWIATLSSSPWFKNLDYNIEQTQDVAAKIQESLKNLNREHNSFAGRTLLGECSDSEHRLHKAVQDGKKVSCEAMQAVMNQIIKKSVFNEFETAGATGDKKAIKGAVGDTNATKEEAMIAEETFNDDLENCNMPESHGTNGTQLAAEEQMNVDD